MIDKPNIGSEKDLSNMKEKNFFYIAAVVFVIIGALNWGLIGLQGFDLVSYLFGSMTLISRTIYMFVGFSGAYLLYRFRKFT
jgi:uncharacterized membrane protein YuzA (DUF378 family)